MLLYLLFIIVIILIVIIIAVLVGGKKSGRGQIIADLYKKYEKVDLDYLDYIFKLTDKKIDDVLNDITNPEFKTIIKEAYKDNLAKYVNNIKTEIESYYKCDTWVKIDNKDYYDHLEKLDKNALDIYNNRNNGNDWKNASIMFLCCKMVNNIKIGRNYKSFVKLYNNVMYKNFKQIILKGNDYFDIYNSVLKYDAWKERYVKNNILKNIILLDYYLDTNVLKHYTKNISDLSTYKALDAGLEFTFNRKGTAFYAETIKIDNLILSLDKGAENHVTNEKLILDEIPIKIKIDIPNSSTGIALSSPGEFKTIKEAKNELDEANTVLKEALEKLEKDKADYLIHADEYDQEIDKYWKTKNVVDDLTTEVENLKKEIDDNHFNEATLKTDINTLEKEIGTLEIQKENITNITTGTLEPAKLAYTNAYNTNNIENLKKALKTANDALSNHVNILTDATVIARLEAELKAADGIKNDADREIAARPLGFIYKDKETIDLEKIIEDESKLNTKLSDENKKTPPDAATVKRLSGEIAAIELKKTAAQKIIDDINAAGYILIDPVLQSKSDAEAKMSILTAEIGTEKQKSIDNAAAVDALQLAVNNAETALNNAMLTVEPLNTAYNLIVTNLDNINTDIDGKTKSIGAKKHGLETIEKHRLKNEELTKITPYLKPIEDKLNEIEKYLNDNFNKNILNNIKDAKDYIKIAQENYENAVYEKQVMDDARKKAEEAAANEDTGDKIMQYAPTSIDYPSSSPEEYEKAVEEKFDEKYSVYAYDDDKIMKSSSSHIKEIDDISHLHGDDSHTDVIVIHGDPEDYDSKIMQSSPDSIIIFAPNAAKVEDAMFSFLTDTHQEIPQSIKEVATDKPQIYLRKVGKNGKLVSYY